MNNKIHLISIDHIAVLSLGWLCNFFSILSEHNSLVVCIYADAISKPPVTPQVIKITDMCTFFFSVSVTCFVLTVQLRIHYEWIKRTENVLKDAMYEDEKDNSHLSLTVLLLRPLLWLSHLELVLPFFIPFLWLSFGQIPPHQDDKCHTQEGLSYAVLTLGRSVLIVFKIWNVLVFHSYITWLILQFVHDLPVLNQFNAWLRNLCGFTPCTFIKLVNKLLLSKNAQKQSSYRYSTRILCYLLIYQPGLALQPVSRLGHHDVLKLRTSKCKIKGTYDQQKNLFPSTFLILVIHPLGCKPLHSYKPS